jgi:magnesium chelatase family protein
VVEVEADLAQGLPGFTMVGLPDAALAEARDRVRAAVVNCGQAWPQRRITVGLSPASLPKRGSGFDLALAAAVLAADGVLPAAALLGRVLLGELGLDGAVRPVRGVLPSVVTASRAGFGEVVVPADNLAEARLLPGVRARGCGRCTTCSRCSPACPSTSPSRAGSGTTTRARRRPRGRRGQVLGRTAIEVARPAGTTPCCSGRRAAARPCWPSGCRGSCRR